MRLQLRFVLLLLVLFAALVAGIWVHERLDASDAAAVRGELEQERRLLVERLVELTGEPLKVYMADYSPWDDMVNFVGHPDPEWARINLNDSLATHHLDAAWVLRPDFTEVYATAGPENAALRRPPLNPDQLKKLTTGSAEPHCYALTEAGLLELRVAPIRPSDLQASIRAPSGWLVAARRWDRAYLQQLEILLSASVTLSSAPLPDPRPGEILTTTPLPDWQGRTVRDLHTAFSTPSMLRADTDARSDMIILSGFGLVALLAFAVATQLWVVRPLRRLGASLEQRRVEPLGNLPRTRGEFGALSRRIAESYQQEEKLRQIYTAFNAIDDAVFITDSTTGVIIHANLGATRLLGHAAEELQARPLADFKAPAPVPGGDGLWLRCRDGRLVEVETSEQALPGTLQRMSVTVARDISGRRRQEQLRLRAQRMESLGTLAGGVAHDMNNMLTPITLMLDDLQHGAEAPDPALVASVRSSVKRGATMLRQLLTFGRGIEGERAPLELERLVEELGRIVESTFPKSVSFHTTVVRGLPSVVGDSTQLHQVLLNLCVNARDAMPDGGTLTVGLSRVHLPGTSSIWPEAGAGDYVMLEVADTGVGIAAEHVERIFDPFFTTKSADKGTGLGLSTTLGIVRGHDGHIQVRSQPGRGTCFSILLPAANAGVKPGAEVPESANTFNGAGRTALVLEDEDAIRLILVQILKRLSFTTIAARNGREGLELYRANRDRIGVVITDLQMPDLDGHHVLRTIRAEQPNLPILVMSGRVDESVLAALRQEGMTRLLDKPFSFPQIIETLRATLG